MIKCEHFLFPKLSFDNAKEKRNFNNYIDFKGVYLHRHIYELILQFQENCSYEFLSSVIKYDKGIRNVLFKYLSAIEESYRSKLFESMDTKVPIKNVKKARIEKLDLFPKSRRDVSYLYDISFSHNFTFGKLRETLNKYDIISDEENTYLNEIIPLRNKVMHHNNIITNMHRDIVEVEKEIDVIESYIGIVYSLLPDGAKNQFEKAINRCNNIGTRENSPNITKLCLGEMKNGVFTKK